MISIGLDIGSVAAKGVLLGADTQYRSIIPTGWSPRDAGNKLIGNLLAISGASHSSVDRIVVTGYGRIALDCADKAITEISCHARGIAAICPGVQTIIDIGGQDSKVIRVNEQGKVLDFSMNDKCAAGTGRFLQVMANALGMDVDDLGEADRPGEAVVINSMCTVFAESEIVSLLAQGASRAGVITGLHQSVARRVAGMARRVGIKEKVAFTGGVAKNAGVIRALTEELGCYLEVPENCQFTGALGAALMGFDG